MTGVLVPVVGPSGAGKDTLIAAARDRLGSDPRFLFVRRMVTRPAGEAEDHDTIGTDRFDDLRQQGAFVLSWEAHGLRYGIPAAVTDATRAGRIAVANLSRGVLDEARAIFPAVLVVSVTAPPAVLAERIAGRGRESREEIERRIARVLPAPVGGRDVVAIDNGGELGEAVDRFTRLLLGLASPARSGQ